MVCKHAKLPRNEITKLDEAHRREETLANVRSRLPSIDFSSYSDFHLNELSHTFLCVHVCAR